VTSSATRDRSPGVVARRIEKIMFVLPLVGVRQRRCIGSFREAIGAALGVGAVGTCCKSNAVVRDCFGIVSVAALTPVRYCWERSLVEQEETDERTKVERQQWCC